MKVSNSSAAPDYLTYPKRFAAYKWYKPLLVILVGGAIYFGFLMALSIFCSVFAASRGVDLMQSAASGYDKLDAYSALGALLSLGSIAIAIPALMLGNRIINYRSFSSYSSSRSGFDFAVFFKCFAASLVLIALPLVLISLFTAERGEVKFSILGFVFCSILVPLQCCAEEYVFRGHLMQMFGSWIKIPVIPIILQNLFFAAAHPYNVIGVISVGLMGIALGVCAYITKGLESSCALHVVNNMTTFYLAGFGIGGVRTDVDITELIAVLVFVCLYLAFIIFADKKLGWFSKFKRDDAAEFDAKIAARKAR